MSTTFKGFSEEELQRIKHTDQSKNEDPKIKIISVKQIDRLGSKLRKPVPQYKLPQLNNDINENTQGTAGSLNEVDEACKLSTKPVPGDRINNNEEKVVENIGLEQKLESSNSPECPPDVVKNADNYNVNVLAAHAVKLGELQLQQKLMEEQNKKRKEMLAKALEDRTKKTEEEVIKLEKIKKELQVLDGQFSQDVAILRKKIDQACHTYAEAEKHYLKVEKEFLQAKIILQKEKEKKELLTEHLCALITHNETRKAQKLETLMVQLVFNGEHQDLTAKAHVDVASLNTVMVKEDNPIIVDGVDERTGKMLEIDSNTSTPVK